MNFQAFKRTNWLILLNRVLKSLWEDKVISVLSKDTYKCTYNLSFSIRFI